MPSRPPNIYASTVATATRRTGITVLMSPVAIPSIMVTAAPLSAARASLLAGPYSAEVKYSVAWAIRKPAMRPATTAQKSPSSPTYNQIMKKLAIIIRMLLTYTPRFMAPCAIATCFSNSASISFGLTERAPIMEQTMPAPLSARGKSMPFTAPRTRTPSTIEAAMAET